MIDLLSLTNLVIMLTFEKALPAKAQIISALAIKSKAHWGYNAEFMSACIEELSYSSEDIKNENNSFFTLRKDEEIIGFYKLENLANEEILLEALFIEPREIGNGYGKALFEHAKSNAINHGATVLILQSDPNAEGFYQAQGMHVIGKEASESIPGRYLTTFCLSLI